MKKSEQKINAYERLLFDDGALTEEKRLWLAVCKLEEGQDKLRRTLFREVGELKTENLSLKQMLWDLKTNNNQIDAFSDLFAVAK
jgi:hypothetical protein